MLWDKRMIGREIDCEIERDLEAARVDFAHQPVEIFERPEFGSDILMAATVRAILVPLADGVKHARFPRFAGHGVVAPLTSGDPDRMDRRKINYVKAHRLRVIDSRQAIAES